MPLLDAASAAPSKSCYRIAPGKGEGGRESWHAGRDANEKGEQAEKRGRAETVQEENSTGEEKYVQQAHHILGCPCDPYAHRRSEMWHE